ncbi:MAG: rhomboid family intramembrane serine protease [Alphaproteobacteria bacterium]|nr:rhomboid family intramembrane serine protease [Alphaproteobacteria bacterium]
MPIPIADENPTHFSHKSIVTIGLIALNVLVFVLFQQGLFDEVTDASVLGFGLVPSVFWGDKILPPGIYNLGGDNTIVSYMFLHGGMMHLVSNMLILWVFGDNIEQALGRYRFLAFYIIGGMAAGYLHAWIMPSSDAPLVGASGAISAVSAAYLLLHPKAKLWLLLFWVVPVKTPAWAAILAWFVYQLYASVTAGAEAAVAWWAHIGGFIFGLAYILVLKRQLIDRFYVDLFVKKID